MTGKGGEDLFARRKLHTEDVLSSSADGHAVDFDSLLLSKPILRALREEGFEKPSPVQQKVIPLGRCGMDVIAQAKSGTGKTVVFAVVAVESVDTGINHKTHHMEADSSVLPSLAPQVLILAPTREVALQIGTVTQKLCKYTKGVTAETFIGGFPLRDDIRKLQTRPVHIAIGTPGRVCSLLEEGYMEGGGIKMLILDEGDKLFDSLFHPQVDYINSMLPPNKQMIALSATYPPELMGVLKSYMCNPVYVVLDGGSPALKGVSNFVTIVGNEEEEGEKKKKKKSDDGSSNNNSHDMNHNQMDGVKNSTLNIGNFGLSAMSDYLLYEKKVQKVCELLAKVPFQQAIIFINHRGRAADLSNVLTANGFPATSISGGISQQERVTAMKGIRSFDKRVLVSTDLTARGIDLDKVSLVINLDAPYDKETFFHRIGRTGRFGTYGISISILSDFKMYPEQESEVEQVVNICLDNGVPLNPLPHCDWCLTDLLTTLATDLEDQ
eukprot:Nk52_evm16s123 gene=Nk52_evmTU16s123